MVDRVLKTLRVSERRACQVLGQARTTQRHSSHIRNDEERLVARTIELATQYGRYGYRRITALLKQEGWKVNHKRVERIWRKEDLKVPKKQPKRGRLWLNDGSCIRLMPEYKDHVWSYDLMMARTALREEHSGYSLSSMNTPGSASRFLLSVGSLLRILSSSCFIYLYSGVLLNMFGLITVLNSLQRRYANG